MQAAWTVKLICLFRLKLILSLNDQDCTILSGDVIIRHLAQLLTPKYVVFLVLLPSLRFHGFKILWQQLEDNLVHRILYFVVLSTFNSENLFFSSSFFICWAHFLLLFLAYLLQLFYSFLTIDNFMLSASLKIEMQTDVHGVYDRPPTDPNAVLMREIGQFTWHILIWLPIISGLDCFLVCIKAL